MAAKNLKNPRLARIGQTLRGKWLLLKLIGEGGTAAVYEAVHRNGKRGAVKILHSEWKTYAEARERFLYEGQIANRVKHAGIVAALDDDQTQDGCPFLVMELLEGETIDEQLRRYDDGRMPAREACRIGIDLLDVLEAVHAEGIVHRDLKPENIFLTRDRQVKLLDFGIASAKNRVATHKTRFGVAMGTPGYMPAEQTAGDWDQVDARTDVWAVGAVLFTMLTGACVHDADSQQETLALAMTKGAPRLEDMAPDAPRNLAAVVDKALQFHPSDRWQDATEMRAALIAVRDQLEAAEQAPPRVDTFVPHTALLEPRKRSLPPGLLARSQRAIAYGTFAVATTCGCFLGASMLVGDAANASAASTPQARSRDWSEVQARPSPPPPVLDQPRSSPRIAVAVGNLPDAPDVDRAPAAKSPAAAAARKMEGKVEGQAQGSRATQPAAPSTATPGQASWRPSSPAAAPSAAAADSVYKSRR